MRSSSSLSLQPFDIIDNYRVIKQIANGGFGSVYLVRENVSNQPYAMKISKSREQNAQIDVEHTVLKQMQGSLYFPRFHACGKLEIGGAPHKYVVMELLGPSLSQLQAALPGSRYSISTALRLGVEMVCMLRELHSRGFVHRDIKPSNFLVRKDNPTPLCLVDFGLSKRFWDPTTGNPHVQQNVNSFIGTSKYSSVNAHKKVDLGPSDDMIMWFHSLIEMIAGALPWNNVSNKELIMKMKESISPEELCKNAPKQLLNVYSELLKLGYEDIPDYDMILLRLSEAMRDAGVNSTEPYDWCKLSEEEQNSIFQLPLNRRISDVYDFNQPQANLTNYSSVEYINDTLLLGEDDESDKKFNFKTYVKKIFHCGNCCNII